MAARTYAPQFARLLKHVAAYYLKHQAKINAVASAQQQSDAATIVATINSANGWNSVQTTEQP